METTMTATNETVTAGKTENGTFVAPGQPGSLVDVKPRYENFIGGRWVAPVKGQYMKDISPVTGQPFTEVA
jgi:aldehyde dehydrogenase